MLGSRRSRRVLLALVLLAVLLVVDAAPHSSRKLSVKKPKDKVTKSPEEIASKAAAAGAADAEQEEEPKQPLHGDSEFVTNLTPSNFESSINAQSAVDYDQIEGTDPQWVIKL